MLGLDRRRDLGEHRGRHAAACRFCACAVRVGGVKADLDQAGQVAAGRTGFSNLPRAISRACSTVRTKWT